MPIESSTALAMAGRGGWRRLTTGAALFCLAIVGMQAVAIKSVSDSKTRSDASFLANELMAHTYSSL